MGMQAQEDETKFIGDKTVLDYTNAGLKEFKLHHRVYNASALDLGNNKLGEIILPAGMIELSSLRLTGNPNFTNLVIQMDTAIDARGSGLSVYLDGVDNLRVSLPSRMTGKYKRIRVWIPFKEYKHRNLLRRNRMMSLPLEEIDNLEIRPNGVEMVRYSETLPDYKKRMDNYLGRRGVAKV